MVTIPLVTSDSKIWNLDDFIIAVGHAMADQQPITIDLVKEGPDLESLELIPLLKKLSIQFDYAISNISITTYNHIQPELPPLTINKQHNWRFVQNTRDQLATQLSEKQITHHFGLFIGRSNLHRLALSSYLWKHCQEKTIQSFHYDWASDFHKDNLGLDQLIQQQGPVFAEQCVDFLKHCPMLLDDRPSYPILIDQHCNIHHYYRSFFVEIVCETYYSGSTFFPTEKLWRSIALKTPFIVQGPQNFLSNLHKLGFKTFSQWWDEGYSEDPGGWQVQEIIKVIDYLSNKTVAELEQLYKDMQSVIEHNYQLFCQMTPEDFKCLK